MFKKQTYQNDSRILNKVVENMDNMLQNIEDRIFSFYISDLVYTSSGRSENYAVALSERMTYEPVSYTHLMMALTQVSTTYM